VSMSEYLSIMVSKEMVWYSIVWYGSGLLMRVCLCVCMYANVANKHTPISVSPYTSKYPHRDITPHAIPQTYVCMYVYVYIMPYFDVYA